jgi:hypothetical protein
MTIGLTYQINLWWLWEFIFDHEHSFLFENSMYPTRTLLCFAGAIQKIQLKYSIE